MLDLAGFEQSSPAYYIYTIGCNTCGIRDTTLGMNSNPTYGIVGSGRVARHVRHYFDCLNIAYVCWDRQQTASVEDVLADCDIVLVLIRDDAIEPFLEKHGALQSKVCIHFSGSLITPLAQGAHPHCNFTQHLYDLALYQKVPFVLERGKYTFENIFPQLPNPHFSIDSDQRARYHALCVMCGNFPTIIWQQAAKGYKDMGLPEDLFHLYIHNIARQYTQDPSNALTGPFARKDSATITRNHSALKNGKLKAIYACFRKVFM